MDTMDTGAPGQPGNPVQLGQLYVGFKHSTKVKMSSRIRQESMMLNSSVVNCLIRVSSIRSFADPMLLSGIQVQVHVYLS